MLADVNQATWSRDDRKVLTRSADYTARIWYVRMQDLISAACHWTPRNMTENEWGLYMEGPYRPTCPTAPLPIYAIKGIETESKVLIQQGEVMSATHRLEQLNGWLQTNGQSSTYGVDVSAFVGQTVASATAEALPQKNNVTPTPP